MAETAGEIRGLIATCLTPFQPDGAIDFEALRREIDYLLAFCQPSAIGIATGEDTEYAMLGWEQRMELMARGTELVAGRAPVILGISHPAPERALDLAAHARAAGGSVVHLLLPMRLWGGEPDPEDLYAYVAEVAARSPLPLCLCQDRRAGADPGVLFLLRASADLRNVRYVVDTSGDLTRIGRLVEEIDQAGRAGCFTTIESLLVNLTLGGSGAVMPPPAAYVGSQVVQTFTAGDMEAAVRWQRILSRLPSRWARYGLPPVMKAAMRHLGIDLGDPAPPYAGLSPWDDAVLGQFLEEVGLKERGEREMAAPQHL